MVASLILKLFFSLTQGCCWKWVFGCDCSLHRRWRDRRVSVSFCCRWLRRQEIEKASQGSTFLLANYYGTFTQTLWKQIILRTDLVDAEATSGTVFLNHMNKEYMQKEKMKTKKLAAASKEEPQKQPKNYSLIYNDVTVMKWLAFFTCQSQSLTFFLFSYDRL